MQSIVYTVYNNSKKRARKKEIRGRRERGNPSNGHTVIGEQGDRGGVTIAKEYCRGDHGRMKPIDYWEKEGGSLSGEGA